MSAELPIPREQEERSIDETRRIIGFGMDAEKFMSSAIGQYLTRRANEAIEEATAGLRTADPENPKEIRKLQNDALSAERFLQWMGEAVTEGELAEQAFISGQEA